MLPTDIHFYPLPLNIATLLQSFAAVEGHPNRRHHHNYYNINFDEKEGVWKAPDGISTTMQRSYHEVQFDNDDDEEERLLTEIRHVRPRPNINIPFDFNDVKILAD